MNKLNGSVQDLLAAQEVQQKRIADLAKDLDNVREQASKPAGNFASQEELQKLAAKLQEIDDKRVADNEKILTALEALKKAGTGPRAEKLPNKNKADVAEKSVSGGPEKGSEYEIQSGDTLSAICLAYREKGIKVSPEQILKANPGVKATSLQVGQKIFIPRQ